VQARVAIGWYAEVCGKSVSCLDRAHSAGPGRCGASADVSEALSATVGGSLWTGEATRASVFCPAGPTFRLARNSARRIARQIFVSK
jgi:hypothetical protein